MILRALILLFGICLPGSFTDAQSGVPFSVDIVATVPGCGDGFIGAGEECDGSAFGGTTCNTLGFAGGPLSCSSACTFVTDMCSLDFPSNQNSTRVGGRTNDPVVTNLVVSGKTVPGALVTLLKDGQAAGYAVASTLGSFQITVPRLSVGGYSIQLSAETPRSRVATTAAFRIRILADATTKVSGVTLPFILNTIEVNNGQVSLLGQISAGARVVVHLGVGSYEAAEVSPGVVAATLPIPVGYTGDVRVETIEGNQSFDTFYPIPEARLSASCGLLGDVTGDCRVNLDDFVVMLFNVVRGLFVDKLDLSNDGNIDIVDFSLLAFYWTG